MWSKLREPAITQLSDTSLERRGHSVLVGAAGMCSRDVLGGRDTVKKAHKGDCGARPTSDYCKCTRRRDNVIVNAIRRTTGQSSGDCRA